MSKTNQTSEETNKENDSKDNIEWKADTKTIWNKVSSFPEKAKKDFQNANEDSQNKVLQAKNKLAESLQNKPNDEDIQQEGTSVIDKTETEKYLELFQDKASRDFVVQAERMKQKVDEMKSRIAEKLQSLVPESTLNNPSDTNAATIESNLLKLREIATKDFHIANEETKAKVKETKARLNDLMKEVQGPTAQNSGSTDDTKTKEIFADIQEVAIKDFQKINENLKKMVEVTKARIEETMKDLVPPGTNLAKDDPQTNILEDFKTQAASDFRNINDRTNIRVAEAKNMISKSFQNNLSENKENTENPINASVLDYVANAKRKVSKDFQDADDDNAQKVKEVKSQIAEVITETTENKMDSIFKS